MMIDEMTPEELVLRKERENQAAEALGFITEENRRVLLWRMEDPPVTFKEIGRRMGISAPAVHKRYTKTMKKLREHVDAG